MKKDPALGDKSVGKRRNSYALTRKDHGSVTHRKAQSRVHSVPGTNKGMFFRKRPHIVSALVSYTCKEHFGGDLQRMVKSRSGLFTVAVQEDLRVWFRHTYRKSYDKYKALGFTGGSKGWKYGIGHSLANRVDFQFVRYTKGLKITGIRSNEYKGLLTVDELL